MTAPGTRRPQEGQCERCDRPLCAVTDETQCSGPDVCHNGRWGCKCDGEPVDWRARALAAESRLSVPATSAALDAFRANRAATHVCEHGSLARKCGNCDSIENWLESDAWQARALAAEQALADAEASGRAHGLLAAAMLVESEVVNNLANRACVKDTVDRIYWDGVLDEDESVLGDISVLAAEANDEQ